MTFKLTADTDPATIMYEGYPEVTISKIVCHRGVQFYVYVGDAPPGIRFGSMSRDLKTGNNHLHHADGRDVAYNPDNVWPRIVPRNVLDPALPLFGRLADGSCFRYNLIGTFTPADGSEPILHVTRAGHSETDALEILASTGKVKSGYYGSGVTFSNAQIEEVTISTGQTVRLTIYPDTTINAEFI